MPISWHWRRLKQIRSVAVYNSPSAEKSQIYVRDLSISIKADLSPPDEAESAILKLSTHFWLASIQTYKKVNINAI